MRKKRFAFIENWGATVVVIAAAAVVLRLLGIDYGLPAVFNGDEPHLVNTAVSFGRGSLNPMQFKYPTLWMYTLFATYGAYFLGWSGFGLLHSVGEFGQLYVWQPGGFYLLGRLLSAGFGLWAIERIYRCVSELGGERVGLWAAGLAAVSPALIEAAHTAKPDSLMLCLAAWSWLFAARYLNGGKRRDLALCGAAVGLAISTQYTAAPLAIIVPVAWWARYLAVKRGPAFVDLCLALGLIPLLFIVGSPYSVLNFPAFWQGFSDNWAAYGGGANTGSAAGLKTLTNLLNLAGHWSVGGLAFIGGCVGLLRKERAKAALIITVPIVFVLFFSMQSEGGWKRYLFACMPGVLAAAAFGVESLMVSVRDMGRQLFSLQSAMLALLMLPGAIESWAYDRDLMLPDTRTVASEWITRSISPGAKILSDLESDSPRIRYSKVHAERLLQRTREAGHARARYYEFMVSGHPGGGYEVFQVYREAGELHAGPRHAEWSAAGRPVLDVRGGLEVARAAGIEFVVLTSYGAAFGDAAALQQYLAETRERGELLAAFRPRPGFARGPEIWIYRIREKEKEA
jgi:hypothetical protein